MTVSARGFSSLFRTMGGCIGAIGIVLVVAGCAAGPQTSLKGGLGRVDLSPRAPVVRPSEPISTASLGGFRTAQHEYYPSAHAEETELPRRQYASLSGVVAVGEGYELNLDEAPVAEVVRLILGDTLGKTYLIDPRVHGTITLSTGRTVSEDELLRVLEVALQINEAALVKEHDQYKVVPALLMHEGAVQGSASFGRLAGSDPPGFGVSVLPLRHVRAQNILEVVDSFVARTGSVRAIVRGNLLVLRGTAPEREALLNIVLSFDVDWMRDQSAALGLLAHNTPDEIIPKLEAIYLTGLEAEDKTLIRFIAIERLNGILVLGSDSDRIKGAMDWIARLDRENQEGTNYYVYQVQNGKAPELAKLLSDSFGQGEPGAGLGREVAPDQAVAEIGTKGNLLGQASGRVGERGDATGHWATNPSDASNSTSQGPTGAIRITASATDNTLIIRAPQREYRKILAVLREVDRAAPQVMINTTLAEVTLNDNLSYGVQAFLKSKHVSLDVFTAGGLLAPKFPGLNFLLGSSSDPTLILDALAQVTSVRIISSPSLVVLNNQPAVIKVGDQVPITTQQVVATQTPDAPIVSAIEYRNAGMILSVTPRVSATGLVTMDIDQELSAVSDAQGTLTPTISQRSITSTISVDSRQTVVLGGLMSSQETHDRSGLPLVSNIPVLGNLFGTTGKRLQRTELIVFITPQVIRNSIEASEVSEELRKKLQLLAH